MQSRGSQLRGAGRGYSQGARYGERLRCQGFFDHCDPYNRQAMSTTDLFVELIIIGIGALLWIPLTLLSIFGYSWVPLEVWATSLDQLLTIVALIPALSITYVLGILVDRLGDRTFQGWDKRIRNKCFSDPADYQRARTIIYNQSESLSNWFQYGRSRLRICRGWAVNSVLCVLGLNLFTWSRVPGDYPRMQLALLGSLFFGLLL
jgi:hypothetical protein